MEHGNLQKVSFKCIYSSAIKNKKLYKKLAGELNCIEQ